MRKSVPVSVEVGTQLCRAHVDDRIYISSNSEREGYKDSDTPKTKPLRPSLTPKMWAKDLLAVLPFGTYMKNHKSQKSKPRTKKERDF